MNSQKLQLFLILQLFFINISEYNNIEPVKGESILPDVKYELR